MATYSRRASSARARGGARRAMRHQTGLDAGHHHGCATRAPWRRGTSSSSTPATATASANGLVAATQARSAAPSPSGRSRRNSSTAAATRRCGDRRTRRRRRTASGCLERVVGPAPQLGRRRQHPCRLVRPRPTGCPARATARRTGTPASARARSRRCELLVRPRQHGDAAARPGAATRSRTMRATGSPRRARRRRRDHHRRAVGADDAASSWLPTPPRTCGRRRRSAACSGGCRQTDHLDAGQALSTSAQQRRVGAVEPVDRLRRVADQEQVVGARRRAGRAAGAAAG